MASPKPSAYQAEKLDDDDVHQPPSLSPTPPSPGLVLLPREIFIASIYPLTLIAGSAVSVFSPSSASTNFHFSHKRNPLNVFFVKYGWLWTTLVFLIHTSRLRSSLRVKALLRYAFATIWWILVTQWFFGPPIMDLLFWFTGGECQLVDTDPMRTKEEMGPVQMVFSSAACKVAGGKWSGGHDLSGHAFLLTHASLFLWSELSCSGVAGWESAGVLALLVMWWWMLLMTGIYFHTWLEKITGWIAAMLYAWALRSYPTVWSTLGVPGV
ncbi:unnamed protein product [Tuber melanosporum]|uniref:Acyl-coenzyme A diphosphatase SCS3 n=1 Tax=Tuber melanosporum (strain Mel28) TaxID=656061 RepID=D5G8Q6_TUBMM|nr:uncharacterized protein GSTUM_00003096001 [Tuber melanosporum]CAZ80899.1 unnamed protein product [Tuber melanosporum]